MNPTAADLRAAIARSNRPLYVIAAEVGLHPSHLGQMLRERSPMRPDIAARIVRVLQSEGQLSLPLN